MAKSSSRRATIKSRTQRHKKPLQANVDANSKPDHPLPNGKLGALLTTISSEDGASIVELSAQLGWQQHTTRAAISRLRKSGFEIETKPGAEGAPSRYHWASTKAPS